MRNYTETILKDQGTFKKYSCLINHILQKVSFSTQRKDKKGLRVYSDYVVSLIILYLGKRRVKGRWIISDILSANRNRLGQ